jgi:hypothetical protein
MMILGILISIIGGIIFIVDGKIFKIRKEIIEDLHPFYQIYLWLMILPL